MTFQCKPSLFLHRLCKNCSVGKCKAASCRTRILYSSSADEQLMREEYLEACAARTLWLQLEDKADVVDAQLLPAKMSFSQATRQQVDHLPHRPLAVYPGSQGLLWDNTCLHRCSGTSPGLKPLSLAALRPFIVVAANACLFFSMPSSGDRVPGHHFGPVAAAPKQRPWPREPGS
jgi:hypothetical protein